jgi:hypothetical protein
MIVHPPPRHRQTESAGVLGRVKAKPIPSGDHGGLDSPCALPVSRSCRAVSNVPHPERASILPALRCNAGANRRRQIAADSRRPT